MKQRRELWAITLSLILGVVIVELTARRPEAARAQWRDTPSPEANVPTATPRTDCPSVANIVEKALPSVVNISATRLHRELDARDLPFSPFADTAARRETSLGSGVIVSEDGLLLTNNHVIERAELVEVTLDGGQVHDAEILGTDPQSDLAVLRIKDPPKGLVPITFGSAAPLRLGDPVIAIGNPFGVGQTVTTGIVSAKGRADLGIVDYEDFIQTDAAINPGNSGGALVGSDGKLVGLITAILSRTGGYQGISFAIPTDMALPIMRELIEHGKVQRGWLGVSIQDLTRSVAETMGIARAGGVVIAEVGDGSPAARAGLKPRDVVVAVDGEAVHSTGKMRNRIALAGAGREIALRVLRRQKPLEVRAILGELPNCGASCAKEDHPLTDHEGEAITPKSAPSGLSLEPQSIRAFRAASVKRDC